MIDLLLKFSVLIWCTESIKPSDQRRESEKRDFRPLGGRCSPLSQLRHHSTSCTATVKAAEEAATLKAAEKAAVEAAEKAAALKAAEEAAAVEAVEQALPPPR